MIKGDKSKQQYNTKTIIAVIVVFAVVLAFFMVSYIRSSIHKERVVHIKAQTELTKNMLDSTMKEYIDFAVVSAGVVSQELSPGSDVHSFLDTAEFEKYNTKGSLVLVDEAGKWYSKGGKTGKVTNPEAYMSDTDKEFIYFSNMKGTNIDSIVCRIKLDSAIPVSTNNGTANIKYCSVMYGLDKLNDKVDIAFPYECDKIISNSEGVILVKKYDKEIMKEGRNIFARYRNVSFLYGDTSEEQLKAIKKGETSVAEFNYDGGDYFICTSMLDSCKLYATYIIDTDDIASGSYIAVIALFIFILGALFAIGFVVFVVSRMKAKNVEEAAKAKSEFLSNMSHDIRTPINGIVGLIAIAKKEKDPEKTINYLDKIEGSSMHLLSIINDVLDMSSIEAGSISIVPKPVDIRKLASNCTSIIEGQLHSRNLEYVENFEDIKHPYVLADELRIRQVLINILGNAIKFTEDGGRIIYSMKENEISDTKTEIEFEIADTGIGMKPEFVEKIWDRFTQEDDGSRSKYVGTGLGMSISKNFVDMMGGTIDVSSELNKGSCFTVRIPLEICDEPVKHNPISQRADSIDGVKVLMAEDNELNTEIAKEMLEDAGAIVTTANDGLEVVEIFKKEPAGSFDVILMDIMMPKMNGFEACKAIRALDRDDAKRIPIIAMTANALADDIKLAKEAGMNSHLSKPIDIAAVIWEINDSLE